MALIMWLVQKPRVTEDHFDESAYRQEMSGGSDQEGSGDSGRSVLRTVHVGAGVCRSLSCPLSPFWLTMQDLADNKPERGKWAGENNAYVVIGAGACCVSSLFCKWIGFSLF